MRDSTFASCMNMLKVIDKLCVYLGLFTDLLISEECSLSQIATIGMWRLLVGVLVLEPVPMKTEVGRFTKLIMIQRCSTFYQKKMMMEEPMTGYIL